MSFWGYRPSKQELVAKARTNDLMKGIYEDNDLLPDTALDHVDTIEIPVTSSLTNMQLSRPNVTPIETVKVSKKSNGRRKMDINQVLAMQEKWRENTVLTTSLQS